jgi:hypothetical protein
MKKERKRAGSAEHDPRDFPEKETGRAGGKFFPEFPAEKEAAIWH